MTFTAVGTIIAATGAFTLTPGATGDVIPLFAWSSGAAVTAVTSPNVNNGGPWTVLASGLTVGSETVSAFLGTVTGTGAQTLTPTVSGSPTLRIGAQELHSTVGASSVMLYGSPTPLNATGSAWPSLNALLGQCYIGFEFNGGSAVGGSTPGFVFQEDSNGNGLAYKLSTAAGANSPVWGDSDARDVLALLLMEAVPPAAPRLVPPGISPMNFRRRAVPSQAPPMITAPDSGSGTDTATAGPLVPASDTGSGTDSGTFTLLAGDTGSGGEASVTTASLEVGDTGGGTEAVVVRRLMTVRWSAADKLSKSGGTMGGT